jgi:hypothetical protein
MHRETADSRTRVTVDTTETCVIRVSYKDLYELSFSSENSGFHSDARRISCFWVVELLQR